MLHISELGKYAHLFQSHADNDGHVPEHGDHWSTMKFEHGDQDPNEDGITEEERLHRIAYLDEQWWPNVIAQVNQQKESLSKLPDGNPIRKWRDEAMKPPTAAKGFVAE